jgi:uncharacterized protein (DUF362 family)/Pyruvate/2-oxoacid:ferredoxin oxidoreductase delta subunit
MNSSRRVFIRQVLHFIGIALFFCLSPFKVRLRSRVKTLPGVLQMQKKDRRPDDSRHSVAIETCDSYDLDSVYTAIKQGLDAVQFRIVPRISVLLKPNIIGQNTPDQAVTTHPSVVDAVCRIFTEHRCRISIGDSSAFYQGGGTRLGLETSGMSAVAEKYGATLLPFETTRLRRVSSGKALNPFYITGAVYEHDLVVNLPKLKVHRLARYTGALKNTYGCVVGGSKQVYHSLFQERADYKEFWGKPLIDVYEAVNPGLSIMDGIIGLDRDGPAANGTPRKTGLLLISKNGTALDVVACRILGFDPQWVPAVREAISRGLTSLEKAVALGAVPSVPYVKLPDAKPLTGIMKKLDGYMFDQFIVEPRIEKRSCDRCGKCVEDCGPRAISYDSKKFPRIDYEKCIYCYCCEEYCPRRAIYLHGGAVNHIMRGIRQVLKL